MGQAEQEQLKNCLVWDGLVCKKCILSLARLPGSPAQLWQWRARNSYIAGNSAQAMGTGETAGGISQAHLTNQLNRLSRLHRKPKLQRLPKTQECTSCLLTKFRAHHQGTCPHQQSKPPTSFILLDVTVTYVFHLHPPTGWNLWLLYASVCFCQKHRIRSIRSGPLSKCAWTAWGWQSSSRFL